MWVQESLGLRGLNFQKHGLGFIFSGSVLCQGGLCRHLDVNSSACGWPIWLKGQSAKGLASKRSILSSA